MIVCFKGPAFARVFSLAQVFVSYRRCSAHIYSYLRLSLLIVDLKSCSMADWSRWGDVKSDLVGSAGGARWVSSWALAFRCWCVLFVGTVLCIESGISLLPLILSLRIVEMCWLGLIFLCGSIWRVILHDVIPTLLGATSDIQLTVGEYRDYLLQLLAHLGAS